MIHVKGDVKGLKKASRYKGDGDSRSANACIDGLLWVGNAPKKYKTVDDFLKEAQLRGCCRQLPHVPIWAIFGKTKIFLAHRDKHKVPSRGSIFGYFVLHRIEIITRNKVAKSLSKIKKSKIPWPRNVNDYVKDYATRAKKWKDKRYSTQKIERRLEEMLQKSYPMDLASGETTEEPWSTVLGDIMKLIDPSIKELIERLISKLMKKWLNELVEKWLIRDNGGCFPPEYSTIGEGHRMCSIRKGPRSVYAVDALCAAVHDTYQKLLRKKISDERKKSGKKKQETLREIKQENQKSWEKWVKDKRPPKWKAQDLLEVYKGPFHEAVKKHFRPRRYQLKYPIDPRLLNKVRTYGELIVFKKPFPILEKAPQAAFQGICHIDGDKLIDQIAKHTGKKALVPTIYFCKEKEPPSRPLRKMTKEELVTWLAQELHVSKACATSFLYKVSLIAREQLRDFQEFKLPGIGTIRLQGKKARKKIKFSPVKAIRSIRSRKKG